MTIEELYRFVEAAKAGSMGSAAETLNISTQGLSQSIKRFETELGVSLFERNINGVVLTPVGKTIYGYANEILRISQQITECAQAVGNEREVKIRCAIVNSIIADYAKSELDSIAESEKMSIEYLNCGEKRQLDRLFQQKNCEVILTFRHDSNDVYADWRALTIFNLPIGIVVNAQSDLAQNGLQNWSQFSSYSVATDMDEKNIKDIVNKLYADEGIVLRRVLFHGLRSSLDHVAADPNLLTFTYQSKFFSANKHGNQLKFLEATELPKLSYSAYIRKDLPEYKRIRAFLEKIYERMTKHITDI